MARSIGLGMRLACLERGTICSSLGFAPAASAISFTQNLDGIRSHATSHLQFDGWTTQICKTMSKMNDASAYALVRTFPSGMSDMGTGPSRGRSGLGGLRTEGSPHGFVSQELRGRSRWRGWWSRSR
ncbi:uncharacterized protein LY89DRAFT_44936 [Mollisia scopiformis]|uniref:Uncharacterized protein n=1 Tax=Mollisia scopiformis TaxID=149040 RepID=A0A194XDM7_MOLSC|nr:uncharacterized protein LY89DRAFT_44936 [Mollisia scopiformis]KUJ18285.1 hypothetical protein LY89DRAFT_44936 [Mollisia scopiformis]